MIGPLRARLAEATRASHELMHQHPGFAAAAAGSIPARDYRDLLARLYGFHRAFEAGFGGAPADMAEAIALPVRARADALAQDLEALGFASDIEALPRGYPSPAPVREPQWLGALYVVEGSTLGGAHIARALERAGFSRAQRHFFEAHGEARSRMWRNLLDRLEMHADSPDAAAEAERAALDQFEAFAAWMRDWRGAAARVQLTETAHEI